MSNADHDGQRRRAIRRWFAAVPLAVALVTWSPAAPPHPAAALDLTQHGRRKGETLGPGVLYAYNKRNPRPYATPIPEFKPGRPHRRAASVLSARQERRTASAILSKDVVAALAGIIALPIGIQWVAAVGQLPEALSIIIAGLAAGPATGWLDLDALFGNLLLPLVSLLLAVVLFERGMRVRLSDLRRIDRTQASMLGGGMAAACLLTIAAAYSLLHLAAPVALLLGVIVLMMGPNVDPMPRDASGENGRPDAAPALGTCLDFIGTACVVLLFDAILFGRRAYYRDLMAVVVNTVWTGVVAGFLGAGVLGALRARGSIPARLRTPILLTVVVTTFAAANVRQSDSGFFAVIVMGIVLANWRLGRVWADELGDGQTPAVLGAVLLFLLASRLQLNDLVEMDASSWLFLAIVVLVVRPLGVALARMPWRERVLPSARAPHGVVAAGVATVFALRLAEAKLPQAGRVVPLTLVLLCATLTLESLALSIARLEGERGRGAKGQRGRGLNR